jgi:ParB/RepB/Spo0J family partition protein
MVSTEKPQSLLQFRKRLDYVDVDRILPNANNPREPISRREISDIKESIRTMGGVLVPVVVYKEGNNYVLLDGERRWRACKELSKESKKFAKIPANIIGKPLSEIQNIQTMFNIHQKRKEWSTAAKAMAIGRLLEIKGKKLSVAEISMLTGLIDVTVNDALLLLKFPKDIQQRCLDGDLDEFYPILLGRNLRSLEKTFPNIFKTYSWEQIANAFMNKVDKGFVRRARDFNKIGQMAKVCITYESEILFISVFDKLVNDERFTLAEAQKKVEKNLGYKLEIAFRNSCLDFFDSLSSYINSKPNLEEASGETLEVLQKIYDLLKKTIAQKRLA